MDATVYGEKFNDRLNAVEETLEKLVTKMGKLYDAVVGNEVFDQEGLVQRIKKLEKEAEKNKSLRNKLIGAFVGGGAIWTILFEVVKYLMNK